MTERDLLARELSNAEAVHAALLARAATTHDLSPRTDRAVARWIKEAQTHVDRLRERVTKLGVEG